MADDVSRPTVTASLARGVMRMLGDHGFAALLEMPLANGRRADVMALDGQGLIWIVEIKSCVADWAMDQKWPEYRDYCDQFYFATPIEFPIERIASDCGLIVGDGFGGEILRQAPQHPLAAPRRKAMTLAFARLAAMRLGRP